MVNCHMMADICPPVLWCCIFLFRVDQCVIQDSWPSHKDTDCNLDTSINARIIGPWADMPPPFYLLGPYPNTCYHQFHLYLIDFKAWYLLISYFNTVVKHNRIGGFHIPYRKNLLVFSFKLSILWSLFLRFKSCLS